MAGPRLLEQKSSLTDAGKASDPRIARCSPGRVPPTVLPSPGSLGCHACYQCTSCNLRGPIGYDLAKFSGSIVPSAWNSEQAHTVAWAPVDTWRTWQVVAAFSGEAPNFEDKDKLLAATKPRYCHMWVGSSLQVRILDIYIELHWYIYHWQSYWQSFWTHFCTWNVGRERERERGKDRDGGKVALNGWPI